MRALHFKKKNLASSSTTKKVVDDDDTGYVKKPSYYASWDAGDWEGYFAAIRQSDGQSAAEMELDYFIKNGLIPTNMVAMAASGARGGMKGH